MGFKVNQSDRITFEQAIHSDFASANAIQDAFKVFSKIMITGEGSDSVTKFDFKRRKGIRCRGTEGTDNMIDVMKQLNEGRTVGRGVNMLGLVSRLSGKALAHRRCVFKFFAKRRFLYQEAFRKGDIEMANNIKKGMSISEAKIKKKNMLKP